MALCVHYSYERQTDGFKIRDSVVINIGEKDFQYNHLISNRKGSTLSELSATSQELKQEKTNNHTFLQAGTGIVTRVRFPYLRNSLDPTKVAINRAQLEIETEQDRLGYTFPPNFLTLMLANKYGTPTSILQSYEGAMINAVFQPGDASGGYNRSKYVFDMTKYVSDLIRTTNYKDDESIFITIPAEALLSTFDMLKIAKNENRPAIKLNVIYTQFQ